MAGILPADQEAGHIAPGRRRSGLVQEAGARLPDEDQPNPAESDCGREEEGGGMSCEVSTLTSQKTRR